MRVLSGQAVEAESREEASDPSRNTLSSDSQSMMLSDRTLGERIDTSSGAHEDSLAVQAEQKLSRDSKRLNVARTNQWLVRRKAEDAFCSGSGPHVAFYR